MYIILQNVVIVFLHVVLLNMIILELLARGWSWFKLVPMLTVQYPPKKRAFFENYSVFQIQANESP
jgi:hypothetical protein